MHQHPRPAPRTAASASNPSTNPEQTNNSREAPPHRTRSSVDLASYTERAGAEGSGDAHRSASGQAKETSKLNQIVQHFHSKAALMICSSRASLPQVYNKNGDIKQNRWFNIVLDDTDVLLDDLHEWRRPDLTTDPPLPMIIESYIDSSQLTSNQSLVLVDETGKRWDCADALTSSASSSPRPTKSGGRHVEVVLERWTISLGDPSDYTSSELGDALPNVYKKGVVLFRSLYSLVRFLPAFKLYRKLSRATGSQQQLKVKFRIRRSDEIQTSHRDPLESPLCPSDRADCTIEQHDFPPLLCPAGPLSISVRYRSNCEFSVADSEALLSSRFLGLDEGLPTLPAGRSLPQTTGARQNVDSRSRAEVNNARRGLGGAYGSLGTYQLANQRPSSQKSSVQGEVSGDVSGESGSFSRRPFEDRRGMSTDLLKNPPFKAGSVSSSPRPSPSPGTSLGRPGSYITGTSHQKRVSLNTLPQQALRTPSLTNNEAVVASSGSSSPGPRFSSSFAGRQRWQGSQGQRAAESNTSSTRGSQSSKEKAQVPLPGGASGGSSGSIGGHDDDGDDIAAFIKLTEQSKDLPLFSRHSTTGNTVNLAKYSSMRDTGSQLAEDMQSSSLIQTSSTPPSRRLSNVPGLSTSSSPSRALAYTPHVRSRLSAHSIAEENTVTSSGQSGDATDSPQQEEEDELPFIFAAEDV
ncbi:hypothetical protein K431DRAFT_335200 [Polychaeton citri CBS 116435]|uniref:Autophagy-related protein 13 n=1 Tax=Polychaeton citri CBS 116435 TaxID=1314669 RepID=A0A9P4Q2D1_9PEZI|nr:hypothetical protein K431DRAFT_335200 [Polychaeton citri CBS 116435]